MGDSSVARGGRRYAGRMPDLTPFVDELPSRVHTLTGPDRAMILQVLRQALAAVALTRAASGSGARAKSEGMRPSDADLALFDARDRLAAGEIVPIADELGPAFDELNRHERDAVLELVRKALASRGRPDLLGEA